MNVFYFILSLGGVSRPANIRFYLIHVSPPPHPPQVVIGFSRMNLHRALCSLFQPDTDGTLVS